MDDASIEPLEPDRDQALNPVPPIALTGLLFVIAICCDQFCLGIALGQWHTADRR